MTDEVRGNMKDLPDLPGLETIEPRDRSMLPILIYLGFMVSMIAPIAIMTILHYDKFIDQCGKVCIVLCAALVIWVILRLLSGYYRFKTDANGLKMIGVLRRQFIPWIDVKEAYLLESKISGYNLILKTQHGTVKLNPRNWGLIASAWQHLRRFGRVENMVLPSRSLAFWEPVPDDVPHELDWSKKSATGDIILASVVFLLFGGGAISLWFAFPLWSPMGLVVIWLTISVFIMLKWLLLPEALHKPWRIRVREDYIEANLPFAKAYIPWSEITSAHSTNNNSGGLVIKYGSRKSEIRVSYTPGNKESEDLILAIIRKLRTSSRLAIAIPEISSRNIEALYKPVYSSHVSQYKVNAFLNTLDPPVRKRISRLYYAQSFSILLGCAAAFVVMFTSPLERILRSLHSTPDMRFFFTSVDMWLFFPAGVVIGTVVIFIIDRTASKMPSPYCEAWIELKKIQSQGKLDTVVIAVFLIIAAVSLLASIPSVDSYTRVTDQGISVNRFWNLGHEEFYPWSRIGRVLVHESYTSRSEKIVYEVIFTDGKRWKAEYGNLGLLCSRDLDSAIGYIAEKSGKKMEYAESAR